MFWVGRIAVSAVPELVSCFNRELLRALLHKQLAMAKSVSTVEYISFGRRFYAEIVGLSGLGSLREIGLLPQSCLAGLVALSLIGARAIMEWVRDNKELLCGLQLGDAGRAAAALRSRTKRATSCASQVGDRYSRHFDIGTSRQRQLEFGCLKVAVRLARGARQLMELSPFRVPSVWRGAVEWTEFQGFWLP